MKSALLVIDVQQSFTRRPYWRTDDVPAFLEKLQGLIERCEAADIPVVQIFHVNESEGTSGPFSTHSGLVKTLEGLQIRPQATFCKSVHSALFARDEAGQSLEQWLRAQQIGHVIVTGIRTEQCCETTTRHAFDAGFQVTYAMDATLTFPMVSRSGRTFSPAELMERTELVLADRFAHVTRAEAIQL